MLGVVPGLMGIVFFVAGIWLLAATVVAMRQDLDYRSTWRAEGVCLIGWIIQALVVTLVLVITGLPDPSPTAG